MNSLPTGKTKLNIMRKIILLIPFFVFYNCGPEANMFKRTYIIENSLDRTVELKFYNRRTGELNGRTSKTLNGSQNQLQESIEQTSPFNQTSDKLVLFTTYGADSLRIIFDNTKVATQVFYTSSETFSEPMSRNAFLNSNYEAIGNDTFLFKITQEDYQNATPCEGDCN